MDSEASTDTWDKSLLLLYQQTIRCLSFASYITKGSHSYSVQFNEHWQNKKKRVTSSHSKRLAVTRRNYFTHLKWFNSPLIYFLKCWNFLPHSCIVVTVTQLHWNSLVIDTVSMRKEKVTSPSFYYRKTRLSWQLCQYSKRLTRKQNDH